MSSERMLAPPISTVGTKINKMPATRRDCGLMPLLPLSCLNCLQDYSSRGRSRSTVPRSLLVLDHELPNAQ
jgi:hypothetical protein